MRATYRFAQGLYKTSTQRPQELRSILNRFNAGLGSLGQSGGPRISSDWIWRAQGDAVPIERIEAFFSGRGYAMHRHDTYAIGFTLSGVQSFRYRGSIRNSVPGGTLVLHPDELHDGQAGVEGGFRYRMAYIEPAAIQQVLGGRSLPYVGGGLSADRHLATAVRRLLRSPDIHVEAFEYEDILYELAQALLAASDTQRCSAHTSPDYIAAERVRSYLRQQVPHPVTLAQLEQISGRSRWNLSRDFRCLFGTSPYRYLVMRRLDRVKQLLSSGVPAAQAAIEAGFADQSHMTRHFARAFGIPPTRWLRALRR
jgi:AraC-like DNA-binding protein